MKKTIDTPHIDYAYWLPIWQKCRDANAGQYAVHGRGEAYLPKLSGQQKSDYEKYKLRAMFFNATGRTVDGMVGMIMRKEPILDIPDSLNGIAEDIDLKGSDVNYFTDSLVEELCLTNRVGILIDFPAQSTIGMTLAQIESIGIRPYASLYKAEDIIDWEFSRVNNRYMLTMVKLREIDDDKTEIIRVLKLTEFGYQVEIYPKSENGYGEFPRDILTPLMNNAPLSYIPFIFDEKIFKPPLIDLVHVNFAHYKNSADYEHGLHFTGLPTPIFWGADLIDDAGNSIVQLGSTAAYGFSNPNGRAEYLEFTGTGLGALKTAMDDKVNSMIALGSRYLGADKRVAETAESMTIRSAGENSIMGKIAGYASTMMTRAFRIIAEWSRINPDLVSVTINKDVTPNGISPQMMQQLTSAYLAGAISYETYFWNLQQGEVIEGTRTIEDEQASMQENESTRNLGA